MLRNRDSQQQLTICRATSHLVSKQYDIMSCLQANGNNLIVKKHMEDTTIAKCDNSSSVLDDSSFILDVQEIHFKAQMTL